jgi:HK97 family phage portal protein
MATILTRARDFLLGEPPPAAPPPPPPEAAPEVKQFVFTTDTYYDGLADVLYPTVSQAFGGSASTLNSAVYACLKELASAFQEAPLRVSRHGADGTEDWVDEHPLMELLADPHPSLSQAEVNSWLAFTLNVNGNAYLRKIRDRTGAVVQLWPISPVAMRPETTEADRQAGVFISHYLLDDGRGRREEVPVLDVVHFRMGIDDADHRMGMSPLRRLVRELSSDEEATRFTDAVLKNTGVTSLAVTVPPGPVLTQEQADQVRERLQESLTGTNRGRVAVVANGGTVQQLGFSPQQLDLKVAHYIPETRIAAVMGVPPTLINLASGLEHSIYNNVRQGQEHFYEQTINPLWRDVAATYTKQLLWVDYTPDRAVRFRYDTTNVRALQEDLNEVYVRVSTAVEKGWLTKDEARAQVGLEPLPNGLGEAKDPLEQARQMAELTAQNRPPGGQQDDGQQQDGQQSQQERRSRPVPEAKQGGYAYLPDLMALLQTMARPMLEQDLEAYFANQAERVLSRAKEG